MKKKEICENSKENGACPSSDIQGRYGGIQTLARRQRWCERKSVRVRGEALPLASRTMCSVDFRLGRKPRASVVTSEMSMTTKTKSE